MKTFNEYKQNLENAAAAAEIHLFMESVDSMLNEGTVLNESVLDKLPNIDDVNNFLAKIGLKVKKHRSLISMLKSSGKWVARAIYYAFKAANGDEEAKKMLKQTLKNHVTKEEMMDFLLKLDNATLHLIAIPLHTIAAITGWELEANLEKITSFTRKASQKIEDAIAFLKELRKRAKEEIKKKIDDIIQSIKRHILPPEQTLKV